jgi:hypothetical protein
MIEKTPTVDSVGKRSVMDVILCNRSHYKTNK